MEVFILGQLLRAPLKHWWLTLVILATVLSSDFYYTASRQPTYLAQTTLVVGPSASVNPSDLVYSVDSLGRGRVMGTYAEVLESELVRQAAGERLASVYNPSTLLAVTTTVIADTTVIQVSVESYDPELSAAAANAIGEAGVAKMAEIYPLYSLTFLTRATPPAAPYRPDVVRNYSLGLILGLALAAVTTYLFDLLLSPRHPAASMTPVERAGDSPAAQHPDLRASDAPVGARTHDHDAHAGSAGDLRVAARRD